MAFVRTVKVNEVPTGAVRELQVEGKAIAVANVGGKIYAINNTCLHRGGPLGEGALEGKVVTCPGRRSFCGSGVSRAAKRR